MLAYQTVVRDYLAEAPKALYIKGMTDWVEAEAAGGPRRIWIELEAAPDAWKDPGGLPMALDAHIADPADRAGGMATLTLAHCSYHPDLLTPESDALAVFVDRKI